MKKRYLVAALFLVILSLVLLTSWRELSKVDISQIPQRAAWQLTDRVVGSLGLEPGDQVADIGAGDGYFVFPLADAVGPTGRVWAVEVEEEMVRELEATVREKGYSNVEVVLGELDDPLLPDGSIDMVFVCNTYHHITEREDYFARLQADLRPGGRVALLEIEAGLGGIAGLLTHAEHATSRERIYREMEAAGYRGEESFDFLPLQSFEIFQPRPRTAASEEQRERWSTRYAVMAHM